MRLGKTCAQSGGGYVSRLRHAAHDGGGGAALASGPGAAGEWILAVPCLSPDARGVGGVFAARYHSAGVLVPGRGGAALFRGGAHRQGRRLPRHVPARPLALAAVGRSRRLSALHARPANLLHVRRHAVADRPRVPHPVPAGVSSAALAVGRAGCAAVRLLAGVGAVSGAASGVLLRLPGALEHGKQLRQRVRRLVPQSVSDRETIRRQQRRLPDPELHPDSRHHDPRARRRTVAARLGSRGADAAAPGGGRDRSRRRTAAPFHRHLSGGETHLDARVDAVQRRSLFPFPGGLLLADRGQGLSQMGVPAGGDRRQLHRRVPDGPPLGRLHPGFIPHSPGRARLRVPGDALLRGLALLMVDWVVLYWMYRRKLFLKI